MSRNTGNRHRRFQLNPSFAAAHGLSTGKDKSSTTTVNDDEESIVQNIVFKGRKSGKLSTSSSSNNNNNNNNDVTISLFQIQKCWQEQEQQQSKIIDYSNRTPTEYKYVWEEITMVDLSFFNLSITNDENSSFQDFLQSLPMLQTLRLRHSRLKDHIDLSSFVPINLSILDLSGNQISSITLLSSSSNNNNNNNLKEVNLSQNQLQSWNDNCNGTTISMNNLRVLNVQENETFNELPLFEQQSLTQLQQLYASHTSISILPSCYLVSKQLQIVDLSHSKLQQISSSSLYHCTMLQDLNLSYNELSFIPTLPTSIVQCRLEYNQITAIDDMFVPEGIYDNLKELYFHNNSLTDISNVKWNKMTPSLQTLDLRNNDIETIPSSNFVGLTRLKKLYICGNPINNISPPYLIHDISQCTKLIAKLQQQQQRKRPTTMLNTDEILRTKHLKILQQQTNNEDELSLLEHSKTWHALELLQSNTDCMKIQRLTISNQSTLLSIDDWFFTKTNQNDYNHTIFPNVREITICQNPQLSTLPSNLLSWYTHCHTLHLHSNQLSKTTIHSIFNNHKNTTTMLKDIDLSGNKLDELPSCLLSNHYINLERLNVSYNQLSSLNISSTVLSTNLRHLNASNNQLKEISNINKVTCPKLQSLHLENNQLMTIPLELCTLNKTLQILSLHGNPQRMIRTAILERGCQAILSYLQQKQTDDDDDDSVDLNENKANKCFTFKNNDNNQRRQQMTIDTNHSSNQKNNNSTIVELKEQIEQLTLQMKKDHHKLSQAQKYAFKKNLAVQKAKLIKEERKLKQHQQS